MNSKGKKECLHIGIDLGTTNTAMANLDYSGVPKVLPNMDGSLITASAVSVANSPPTVGKVALQDRFFYPELVAEKFKRYMHQQPPVALITSPDGKGYTPVMLSAELLFYLKESAEKLEGHKFTQAVISVPAYFPHAAREATKQAGLIAGFEEVHIVDEPTTAATYYGLAKGENAKIAVFDFGGGTFDISTLQLTEEGQIDPLAVDGDPERGGGNIDEAILQEVKPFVEEKGGRLSPEEDLAEWLEVLDRCKEAKEALAHKDTAIIPLRINGERTSMELTYERLKELCAEIMETLRQCCKRALDKAGLSPSQIDKVVLVGGSTRIRFVPEIVKEVFDQDPVTDTDPDLAVAKGAAIIAAAHFGKPDEHIIVGGNRYLASAVKSREIAPRDLCLAVVNKKEQGDKREYNDPIIPAGSKLPFENTEYYTPCEAKTDGVAVKLYEGHAGELSEEYEPLQQVEVEVEPTDDEKKNEKRIELKTSMDREGLVHIEVRDKLLNKPVPIKFKFHTALSDSEIDEARKQLHARHITSEDRN